jgi:hypothetical protein
MVVRCTVKLLRLLGASPRSLAAHEPSDENWYANLLWLDRRKCLLVTVAREIVPNMMTVIKSPLEIPSGNRVGLAQHVIYGPTGMVLQPIGAFERLWVEAAYPACLRACVEQQLAADMPAILSSIRNLEFHAVGDASELMRSQGGRRPTISDDVDWRA